MSIDAHGVVNSAEVYSCQQKNIVLCIEVLSHDRRKRDVLDNHPNQNEEEYPEDGERFVTKERAC